MKIRTHDYLRLAVAVAVIFSSVVRAETDAWAREVIHFKVDPKTKKDYKTGSTESISDPSKNTLTQITRNEKGTEIARREFLMDSKGRIRRGAIRNAQGSLLATTEYGFDAYDRVNAEDLYHSSGRLIRRLLFKYDAAGRRLPDKFYTWNPKDPYGPLIESKPSADEAKGFLPINKSDKELPGMGIPTLRGQNPTTESPAAPPGPPPKKDGGGFFNKLFNRDKK